MPKKVKSKIEDYRSRIIAAWNKSVDGIFEIGDLLIEARTNLDDEEFHALRNDLPFEPRAAQRLEKMASDKRLRLPEVRKLLPPHWGTIEQLSLCDDEEFDEAIKQGVVTPDLERKTIVAFRKRKSSKSQQVQPTTSAVSTPIQAVDPIKYEAALTIEIPEKTDNYNLLMDLLLLKTIASVIVEKYKPDTAARVAFNPNLKLPEKIRASFNVLYKLIKLTHELENHQRIQRKEPALTSFQEIITLLGAQSSLGDSTEIGVAASVALSYAQRLGLTIVTAEDLKPFAAKASTKPELLGGFINEVEKAVRAITGTSAPGPITDIVTLEGASSEENLNDLFSVERE